jgi:hypothetical protein
MEGVTALVLKGECMGKVLGLSTYRPCRDLQPCPEREIWDSRGTAQSTHVSSPADMTHSPSRDQSLPSPPDPDPDLCNARNMRRSWVHAGSS